jgi:hypothetical protein
MNLVDCYVTKVNGEPVKKYDKWFVPVIANSYGRDFETEIMCDTEEEAKTVIVGYHFLQ